MSVSVNAEARRRADLHCARDEHGRSCVGSDVWTADDEVGRRPVEELRRHGFDAKLSRIGAEKRVNQMRGALPAEHVRERIDPVQSSCEM